MNTKVPADEPLPSSLAIEVAGAVGFEPVVDAEASVDGAAVVVAAAVVVGAAVVVVTAAVVVVTAGPVRRIAGAGSSSSVPEPSDGIAIQRISPISHRWTNGK